MTRNLAKKIALTNLYRFHLVTDHRGGWTAAVQHLGKLAFVYADCDEDGENMAEWFSKKEAEDRIERLRSGRVRLKPGLQWV